MPTQAKVEKVNDLKEKLEKCSIAVTTTFSNISVNEMTELRRRTREAGFEFLVVKNTLMSLAADAAEVPQLKEVMNGPTAIALGYDEPVDVAKILHEYIRTTRSALAIQGAVMGGGPALRMLDVERLASLPPKPQLVSQLLGQMQAPIYGLLRVLNGPLWNFGGILQARIHQLETEGPAAVAEPEAAAEATPAAEAEPVAAEEAPAEPAADAEAQATAGSESTTEEAPTEAEAGPTAEVETADEPSAEAEGEPVVAEAEEAEAEEAEGDTEEETREQE